MPTNDIEESKPPQNKEEAKCHTTKMSSGPSRMKDWNTRSK
jgi:hypothetical protein